MRLDSLIQFFKHVSQCKSSHGIPNGFQFKAILSSRKKGYLLPANYKHDGNDLDQENTMENNRHNRRRRRKQGPITGNPTILSQDISEEQFETLESTPLMAPTLESTQAMVPTPASKQAMVPIPASSPAMIPTLASSPANVSSRDILLASAPNGLLTPEETPAPDWSDSLSPSPRNRASKSKALYPKRKGITANGLSLSEPHRSQWSSVQSIPSTPTNVSQKKKPKKKREKLRC